MIEPRTPQTGEAVGAHYDELDRWYREVWGEHVHHGLWLRGDETVDEATRQLTLHLIEGAAIEPGAAVCDAGCGYGATARLLASEFDARVTGFTLSQAQAAVAAEAWPSDARCRVLCRDFLDNGTPGSTFDAVISIESSEHMPDKPAFFAEAFRILKPGGVLAIYAWLAPERPSPLQVRVLLEPICREGRLPGMGSPSEYAQWFENAGFQPADYEPLAKRVRKTWPIIIGRMAKRLTWDAEARRFLLAGPENRVFAKTVVRICAAYYTGAMGYGLFVARKPLGE